MGNQFVPPHEPSSTADVYVMGIDRCVIIAAVGRLVDLLMPITDAPVSA